MTYVIESKYDRYLTMIPADVPYTPQPHDPCLCGHDYKDHRGDQESCWECPKTDEVCRNGFRANWKKIDVDPREYEGAD